MPSLPPHALVPHKRGATLVLDDEILCVDNSLISNPLDPECNPDNLHFVPALFSVSPLLTSLNKPPSISRVPTVMPLGVSFRDELGRRLCPFHAPWKERSVFFHMLDLTWFSPYRLSS